MSRALAALLALATLGVGLPGCRSPGVDPQALDRRLAARESALESARESAREGSVEVPRPVRPTRSIGDEIVVSGERFSIGAPVVLWSDPGGYDASSTSPRFPERFGAEPGAGIGLRYEPGRKRPDGRRVGRHGRPASLAELREVVDLFVVHYDVCGTSRTCFEVLHDRRGLSVHFLLDLDGTLYQTLDLADTAWHARQANPRSVGIEIANMGAWPAGEPSPLDEWYRRDDLGPRVVLPERLGDGGLRTPDFIARPVRTERVRGLVQGRALEMYDLTPQQYASLVRLARALVEIFPRISPDAPRDAAGHVRKEVLEPAEFEAFHGILGHHHVSVDKVDPGPAFQWESFLRRVRESGREP